MTPIDGQTRMPWRDPAGRDVIEYWSIGGMGHGTPLATRGPEACGQAGPHMLETGISSTRDIARFWQLLPAVDHARSGPIASVPEQATAAAPSLPWERAIPKSDPAGSPLDRRPGAVIERALRAAGLMK